jgi:hypothetical protein
MWWCTRGSGIGSPSPGCVWMGAQAPQPACVPPTRSAAIFD